MKESVTGVAAELVVRWWFGWVASHAGAAKGCKGSAAGNRPVSCDFVNVHLILTFSQTNVLLHLVEFSLPGQATFPVYLLRVGTMASKLTARPPRK